MKLTLSPHFFPLGTSAPSPPGDVAAVPLDDHRLDVRWMAPAGGSVSGFVAEWFAARDDGSAVAPRWEQLNASRTSLVITGSRRHFASSPCERVRRFDPDRGVKNVSIFQRECSRWSATLFRSPLCTARAGLGRARPSLITRGKAVSQKHVCWVPNCRREIIRKRKRTPPSQGIESNRIESNRMTFIITTLHCKLFLQCKPMKSTYKKNTFE